jgi:phenylacetate-coenzyme A ligase PaaK-like adenylate-forming protein
MNTERVLGRFLRANPEFVFHLPEYVESTRFANRIARRFREFRVQRSAASTADETPWRMRRGSIQRVARRIPAYESIEWDREDYWHKIPLLRKSIISTNPDLFLAPSYDQARLWLRQTSGTSGPAVSVWYSSAFFFEWQLLAICKVAWLAGVLDREVRRRTVFCLSLHDNHTLTSRVWGCPTGFRGLTVRSAFHEHDRASVDSVMNLLARHRPAILSLKPNVLESLLQRPDDLRRAVGSALRLVVSGGADLDAGLRLDAEHLLAAPVRNAYGLSEIGGVAAECRVANGLHVYDQELIAEVLGEDGRIAPAGRGELVVSSVANEAMPLLRYCTGDIVDVVRDRCPCGRSGQRIERLSGRILRNYRLADGSELSPTCFNTLLSSFALRELRITQTSVGAFLVEVEWSHHASRSAGAVEAIRDFVVAQTRSLATANVKETVFTPCGKFQRYRTFVA